MRQMVPATNSLIDGSRYYAGCKYQTAIRTKNIELSIAQENLIGVYSPKDADLVADIKKEIIRALSNPIGTKPLAELVKGAKKVVIVADDNTRLTPTDKIIPVILDEMNSAGVKDEQITVIIALGTHRFMTEEEIVDYASVQEALNAAFARHGKNAKVTVLTHAPDMLPIIKSSK